MGNLPKAKPVNYEAIDRDKDSEPYELLAEAIQEHPDLIAAEIGLAWRKNWTANADGQIILGKCIKASDLQREFQDHDFVIVLNCDAFTESNFTRAMRLAVIDHELCHAAVALNKKGNPKYNNLGRPVYRIRKHDIEEFEEIIERHGCFKQDLQQFAQAMKDGPSLFEESPKEVAA